MSSSPSQREWQRVRRTYKSILCVKPRMDCGIQLYPRCVVSVNMKVWRANIQYSTDSSWGKEGPDNEILLCQWSPRCPIFPSRLWISPCHSTPGPRSSQEIQQRKKLVYSHYDYLLFTSINQIFETLEVKNLPSMLHYVLFVGAHGSWVESCPKPTLHSASYVLWRILRMKYIIICVVCYPEIH